MSPSLTSRSTRLRSTDPDKIRDLAESIEGVEILSITVSRKGNGFLLLAGNHRLESFRLLQRETIPATVQDADPLLEELIEVEENLISIVCHPFREGKPPGAVGRTADATWETCQQW